MYSNFSKTFFLNFYKAITIAFFFNLIFPNQDIPQNFDKCLWIKSENLDSEKSIKSIISDAYKSGYKIVFLQLDVHNNHLYNPLITKGTKNRPFDPLNVALYWANLYDIELHVWINAYKIWSSTWPPSEDHIFYQLRENNKDWFASDINGHIDCNLVLNKSKNNFSGIYLSPLNQSSNDYIKDIIQKLLVDYKGKFDGIHLDYFRYKDSMYGYNYIGRKLFQNIYNIDPIYLNKDIDFNNVELNDSIHNIKDNWLEFKNKHIDILIQDLDILLDDYNNNFSKQIKLSVAVKPNIHEAKVRWNQNWDYWLNNDFVDFVVVMNYFSDMESFSNNLWELYKYFYNTKNINKIYIGINTIDENLGENELKDIDLIKNQVKNVQDFSFPGIAIFSSEYYNFYPTLYLDIFSQ